MLRLRPILVLLFPLTPAHKRDTILRTALRRRQSDGRANAEPMAPIYFSNLATLGPTETKIPGARFDGSSPNGSKSPPGKRRPIAKNYYSSGQPDTNTGIAHVKGYAPLN